MKVAKTKGSDRAAYVTAVTSVAIALALVVGAGFIPAKIAAAQTGQPSSRAEVTGGLNLPQADQKSRADEIRQAAGPSVAALRTAGARTQSGAVTTRPTHPVVRRVAPKPVPAVRRAAKKIVAGSGWKRARVSWYGPGFYGHRMAGGGRLTRSSMVVAHRSLRFGTKIQFTYKGRTCIGVVMDRGPFVGGRTFDLGPGVAQALGFGGVGTVQYRVVSL